MKDVLSDSKVHSIIPVTTSYPINSLFFLSVTRLSNDGNNRRERMDVFFFFFYKDIKKNPKTPKIYKNRIKERPYRNATPLIERFRTSQNKSIN